MTDTRNTERILRQAHEVIWEETFDDLTSSLQITRRALMTIGDLVLNSVEPWTVRRMRILAHIESALDCTDGYDEMVG